MQVSGLRCQVSGLRPSFLIVIPSAARNLARADEGFSLVGPGKIPARWRFLAALGMTRFIGLLFGGVCCAGSAKPDFLKPDA